MYALVNENNNYNPIVSLNGKIIYQPNKDSFKNNNRLIKAYSFSCYGCINIIKQSVATKSLVAKSPNEILSRYRNRSYRGFGVPKIRF